MKYSDAVVLQRWAKLQLAIAAARTARRLGGEPKPLDGAIVSPANLGESRGYKALRRWFSGLSPGGQRRTITWMTTQLDGVAKLEAKLRAEGSELDYADLEDLSFDVRATETKTP